jgi:ribosome assembly protein RRB1
MSHLKRPRTPPKDRSSLKSGDRPDVMDDTDETVEFEDPYEDEFESEDDVVEAGVDGGPDDEREAEEGV